MEFAIGALAFGCAFLAVLGMSAIFKPQPVDERLARLATGTKIGGPKSASLVLGRASGLAGLLQRVGQHSETTDVGRLRSRLVHAGYRGPAAPAIFYGIRLTLALAFPMATALAPALWSLPAINQIGLMLLLAAIGFVAPSIFVDRRAAVRKRAITRTLPDALDLMVVCVEAGFGINQSLARVADEFRIKSAILAHEFDLVSQETRAGKSTTEALRALADRTGLTDVSSLVALMVQTERFGTSMADALRVHADSMRIRRMQNAEERAQKATLKLILPSTMIFGALLMLFLLPGMYRFFGAFGG